jgi:starch synthase
VRVVVLGSGEEKYERILSRLQEKYPDKMHFYRGYHEGLAHKIEGGCDVFLMPSLYEPCGLNQMYSLLYGTIPLVRKTGGLADTVQLFEPASGEGNGIVFDEPTSEAVEWALETTLELHANPKLWKKLVVKAMSVDFSWDRSARQYAELYQRVRA